MSDYLLVIDDFWTRLFLDNFKAFDVKYYRINSKNKLLSPDNSIYYPYTKIKEILSDQTEYT